MPMPRRRSLLLLQNDYDVENDHLAVEAKIAMKCLLHGSAYSIFEGDCRRLQWV